MCNPRRTLFISSKEPEKGQGEKSIHSLWVHLLNRFMSNNFCILNYEAAEKDLADLQAKLERARAKAEQQKVVAQKSAEALVEEQKTRLAAQSRIFEVEEDLKLIVTECGALKASKEKDASELKKLAVEHQEAAS